MSLESECKNVLEYLFPDHKTSMTIKQYDNVINALKSLYNNSESKFNSKELELLNKSRRLVDYIGDKMLRQSLGDQLTAFYNSSYSGKRANESIKQADKSYKEMIGIIWN